MGKIKIRGKKYEARSKYEHENNRNEAIMSRDRRKREISEKKGEKSNVRNETLNKKKRENKGGMRKTRNKQERRLRSKVGFSVGKVSFEGRRWGTNGGFTSLKV